MKCFNHPEIDAAGFCRSCGRALCRDCACDVSGITSCKGRCEANVQKLRNQTRQVQDMIKTVETWRKPPKQQPKRTAWLMGLAAAVFLGFGIFLITKPGIDDGAHYLVLSIGLVFALLCVFKFRRQRKVVPDTTQQPTPNALPALPAGKCSNHPEIECIGFCRNCGRTLCRNCATRSLTIFAAKGNVRKQPRIGWQSSNLQGFRSFFSNSLYSEGPNGFWQPLCLSAWEFGLTFIRHPSKIMGQPTD
jgi:hypothetical protein